jgi:hypothetical protein
VTGHEPTIEGGAVPLAGCPVHAEPLGDAEPLDDTAERPLPTADGTP